MVLLFYFNFDKKFKAFLKIANYSWLIKGPNNIKFYQDRLKVLKIKCLVSGLFKLVLRVFFKLTPDIFNKGLRISKVFSEKGFKFGLFDMSGALMVILMLSLSEANSAMKK